MEAKFIPVEQAEQFSLVAQLAEQVWRQHFTPIIGPEQVEYMLQHFQSAEAMRQQTQAGYRYYLVQIAEQMVGYTALKFEDQRMMISKLYTLASARGLGVGKQMLGFIEAKAAEQGANTLWLTVHKRNDGPITWYKRQGFSTVKSVEMDIGEGFVMDDYVMEKTLA